jgi:hypothetical protein
VLEVLNYGSAYCQRIDSPMMVELAILEFNQASGNFLGNIVARGKTPLSIRGDTGTEKFTVPVCYDGRVRGGE